MRRTKILVKILILLLLSFGCYYTYKNYDNVKSIFLNIININNSKKIIIPKESKYHRTYFFETVSETNNFEPKNIDDIKKIYYTVLNNGWNSFTFYCNKEYTTCASDVKIVANSKNDIYIDIINNYVSPFNSYKKYNTTIIDDNEISLTVEKLYTNEEIDKINNVIDTYLNKNNINKNKVSKNDIKKIHDYIIKMAKYDEKNADSKEITDSNKATGVLFNRKALCSGYSDTFALFMDKLNIPNFKITSSEHEWNAIYFNKKWYHVDATWDDDEINTYNTSNFFMVNTKELLQLDKKEHNFDKKVFLEFK